MSDTKCSIISISSRLKAVNQRTVSSQSAVSQQSVSSQSVSAAVTYQLVVQIVGAVNTLSFKYFHFHNFQITSAPQVSLGSSSA